MPDAPGACFDASVHGPPSGDLSTAAPPTIGAVVEVTPAETVVRLDGQGGRLQELVLTADVARALSPVLERAGSPCGAGFFLVGHFGSGKSHFLAALGELLADPGVAQGLTGWDPTLRRLVIDARPSRVVAVPLVEYRARAGLEDVVWRRGWEVLGRPAPTAWIHRQAAWDGLLEVAREAASAGLVVLLDELSEFLRAKQGPSLIEDLRFLQFLGEWARDRPVLVVCALQESIEEVANVSQRELARIRDRYQPSLTLSMRHVEDLVRGRLLRLRPGAEQWVERAYRGVEAAFPGWGVSLERFARCYPLHPDTLSLLEGLRMLFSQQRGVVDFICRQLAGDPASGIEPWQARSYRELLTPDRVYDHFRARLHERAESSRLAQAVVPYYERAVGELFESEADRDLALRAVKLLCLLAASPIERPRTASELAGMLLAEVSGLDPTANVVYLEQAILSPLAGRGAYVVARPGRLPTYSVELEADAAVLSQARVAQARTELALGDRRVIRTLVELGSSPALPLQLLSEVGPARRELLWQNTLRSMLVGMVRIAELSPGEAADVVAQARAVGAEGCLLVSEIEPEGTGALVKAAHQLARDGGRLALWVPALPRPEETEILLELHSRRLVLEAARAEGRAEPGGLVDFLERAGEADAARAREVLRRCYFGGQIVYPYETAVADLPSLAGLPFERQLAALVDPLLAGLHPRHREVAPRGELVGERLLRQLVSDVLAEGRIGATAAEWGQLRSLIDGYLVPLGLVRKRRDAVVVAPDPARSPAVAEALRLVGTADPLPATEVVRGLGEGSVGLTEPEALLVINACVQSGLMEAWRGRRRLTETFLAVTPADRLGAGELVEAGIRSTLAGLAPIPGPGPFEPWSSSAQRAAWDHARVWLEARKEEVAQVRAGLERVEETPVLASGSIGPVFADLEALRAVLDACDPGLAAPAGLRALAGALPDGAAVLTAAGRLSALVRFLREDLIRVEQLLAYLTHPELEIPAEHRRLESLRAEVLDLARNVLRLAAEDRVGALFDANRAFRDAYAATYQQAHNRFYATVSPKDLDEVRASPGYSALARLSEVGVLAVPDDRVKVDRALAVAAPPPCPRRLDLELAWKPRCGCGFSLDQEPPSFERDALLAMAQRGVRQHLAELARPEHLVRLEQAVSDLASLGRSEMADDLRRLLGLVVEADSADPVAVRHLLDRGLVSLLRDVLSGGQMIVQRDLAILREDLIGRRYPKRRLLELLSAWVDPSGEIPPGGFVEVVDSSERTGPGRGPAETRPGLSPAEDFPSPRISGPPPTPRAGATATFLSRRFPGLSGLLPAQKAADAFWLAAWWGRRPSPPAWLPARLLAEDKLLTAAAHAARTDPGALAELAELDSRVGSDSLLGDQVAAALDLRGLAATDVAAAIVSEQLLSYPIRLAADELVRRLAGDWQMVERLGDLDPARLASGHALHSEAELVPLGNLLEAARHLAAIERCIGELSCSELVEHVYPAHYAAVPELMSRAELACARGSLVDPETIDAFRSSGARLLHALDAVFRDHADAWFPGVPEDLGGRPGSAGAPARSPRARRRHPRGCHAGGRVAKPAPDPCASLPAPARAGGLGCGARAHPNRGSRGRPVSGTPCSERFGGPPKGLGHALRSPRLRGVGDRGRRPGPPVQRVASSVGGGPSHLSSRSDRAGRAPSPDFGRARGAARGGPGRTRTPDCPVPRLPPR